MPTIVIDSYKFRFYSSDRFEPPHMHVIKAENVAKDVATTYSIAIQSRIQSVRNEQDSASDAQEPRTFVGGMV